MKKYSIAIIGSRKFDDYKFMIKKIESLKIPIKEILSGGAKGADSLAIKYAKENGIPYKIYKAQWDNFYVHSNKLKIKYRGKYKYNALAGFNRNEKMANHPGLDMVIAFWDIKSPGTEHMLSISSHKGIPIRIFQY